MIADWHSSCSPALDMCNVIWKFYLSVCCFLLLNYHVTENTNWCHLRNILKQTEHKITLFSAGFLGVVCVCVCAVVKEDVCLFHMNIPFLLLYKCLERVFEDAPVKEKLRNFISVIIYSYSIYHIWGQVIFVKYHQDITGRKCSLGRCSSQN